MPHLGTAPLIWASIAIASIASVNAIPQAQTVAAPQPAPSTYPHTSGGGHDLSGTWASGSGQVVTGANFVNIDKGQFNVPSLTGISYSFTTDGHFEEAIYQQQANGTYPQCVQAVLIWQHGTYTSNSDGSLTLNPIPEDGRLETDNPCYDTTATVQQYNQTEQFVQWTTQIDAHRNAWSLQMYGFDGTPLAPMYLAFDPPQMQPTNMISTNSTLKKLSSATSLSSSIGIVSLTVASLLFGVFMAL